METIESKNQMNFGFARKSNIGEIIGEKTIRLSGEILFELNPKQFYLNFENPDEEASDIICTFCYRGRLQLNRVEPLTDKEHHHYANNYEYRCNCCSAKFVGTIFF